jgi:hypothetical protein
MVSRSLLVVGGGGAGDFWVERHVHVPAACSRLRLSPSWGWVWWLGVVGAHCWVLRQHTA